MASRMKEDERNEKIIRGLLKLPPNRKCINCNNLGPQYVCTNFWTFICTNCSGLHREFCHRVKSISMAKFTTQEVNALQEGGNEKAREIYFKEWDPQRHSLPDSSNIDRLRDFIKHVYVERKFTGERNTDRPLRGKADQDDSNDSKRGDSYRGDSRSPPYGDRYGEPAGSVGRNSDRNVRYIYGERSPGHDQGDNKRSPRKFEVVDDRVRDDRYGIRRFEDRRLPNTLGKPEGSSPRHHPNVLAKPEGSSPGRQKDVSNPPVVRPVRDILGDDMPQLRVDDAPKSTNIGLPDGSASTQRTSSTSSMGSTDGNSVHLKRVNSRSLIDFTAEPEHPVDTAPQQPVLQQNTSLHSNGGDWASFDNTGQQKAYQADANVGTLESALAGLSAPGPAPTAMPQVAGASTQASQTGQWPTTQQHQTSLFPADFRQPTNPHIKASVAAGQAWGSSALPSTQGPLPNSSGQSSHVASKPPQEMSVGQPPYLEVKPTGRKELPADLFAALYPSAPVGVSGWQRGPHPGIGYGMQYPMAMPQTMPGLPNPSTSTNPFDLGSEPTLTRVPTFPSMGSLQGALPHVPGPSHLLRSSSFGNPSSQWLLPQQSSFPPAMSQGPYAMQQFPGNMPQQQQQQQFPGNMPQQQQQRFPGNMPQQQQFSGSMPQQQQFPGSMPQQQRFPGNIPQQQHQPQPQQFPGNMPQQQQFPGSMTQQQQFPGNMPQQQQYPGNMPQQQQFRGSIPQQQQFHGGMPQQQQMTANMVMMGHQGARGPGGTAASHGNFGMDHLPPGGHPPPSSQNSFGSSGGNPFG